MNTPEEFRRAIDDFESLLDERQRIEWYAPNPYDPYATPPFGGKPTDDELKTLSGHRSRDQKNQTDIAKHLARMSLLASKIKGMADKVNLRLNSKAEYDALLDFLKPAKGIPNVEKSRQRIQNVGRLLHYLNDGSKSGRKPLGEKASLVYELLISLPEHKAVTGPKILEYFAKKGIDISEDAFYKRIIPELEPYGLINTPQIGYSIPQVDRPVIISKT